MANKADKIEIDYIKEKLGGLENLIGFEEENSMKYNSLSIDENFENLAQQTGKDTPN